MSNKMRGPRELRGGWINCIAISPMDGVDEQEDRRDKASKL